MKRALLVALLGACALLADLSHAQQRERPGGRAAWGPRRRRARTDRCARSRRGVHAPQAGTSAARPGTGNPHSRRTPLPPAGIHNDDGTRRGAGTAAAAPRRDRGDDATGGGPAHIPVPIPGTGLDGVVPARKDKVGDYVYADVLRLALLFFNSQRAGGTWGRDTASGRAGSGSSGDAAAAPAAADRAPGGRDVSGGWYTGGGGGAAAATAVKASLPAAWSAGVLAWSVYEFGEGYAAAGQLGAALAHLRWAADYFLRCVGDGSAVVAQVGAPGEGSCEGGAAADALVVHVLTEDRPGSDAAAAMGAALAAASVVFVDADPAYSRRLLAGAFTAYDFAAKFQGAFSDAVPGTPFRSTSYLDDMSWCAAWLHIRTGDLKYRWAVKELYDKHMRVEGGADVPNVYGAPGARGRGRK
jgi:hypothetical protein